MTEEQVSKLRGFPGVLASLCGGTSSPKRGKLYCLIRSWSSRSPRLSRPHGTVCDASLRQYVEKLDSICYLVNAVEQAEVVRSQLSAPARSQKGMPARPVVGTAVREHGNEWNMSICGLLACHGANYENMRWCPLVLSCQIMKLQISIQLSVSESTVEQWFGRGYQ